MRASSCVDNPGYLHNTEGDLYIYIACMVTLEASVICVSKVYI